MTDLNDRLSRLERQACARMLYFYCANLATAD